MSLPSRVCVVGAGLLGGSLISLLQPRRPGVHLTAVSSRRTVALLEKRGWIDAKFEYVKLEKAVEGADLVILCSPVAAIFDQLERISRVASKLAPGALVVDVGSTKEMLCRRGFELFPVTAPESPSFVGSHPMAGSEKSGLEAADAFLFQSALWVLCPPEGLSDKRLQPLEELIHLAGARPVRVDPVRHDQAVARISHAPQLLATALSAWVGRDENLLETSLSLAAGGFRDMTRLASSSWDMWRDILATNAGNISRALSELSRGLAELAEAAKSVEAAVSAADADPTPGSLESFFYLLAKGDHAQLAKLPHGQELSQSRFLLAREFEAGRSLRARFKAPRKGILHEVSELVVRLEDRPGELVQVLMPLAAEGINVLDLEILKIREGEQGTLLLGFSDDESAQRAQTVLAALNFLVVRR
jgi:prephenate dehydrogenase